MTNSYVTNSLDIHWNAVQQNSFMPAQLDVGKEIEVITLGQFQLRVQGEIIGNSSQTQSKPLEVMKAIIAMGENGVRTEKITDALWPDAESDAAHHALETALYRLRKLLGVKQALILQDGNLRINSHCCWIDFWYFEKLLDQAEDAVREEASLNVIESLMVELKKLYQGPFLHDSPDQYWLLISRERIHYRLLSVLSSMGRLCEKKQSPGQAINLYQRIISLNPLAEESYQNLMRCLKSLGRRAEAMEVYLRCCKNLSVALDIGPSADTEAIFKSI